MVVAEKVTVLEIDHSFVSPLLPVRIESQHLQLNLFFPQHKIKLR